MAILNCGLPIKAKEMLIKFKFNSHHHAVTRVKDYIEN